MKTGPFKPEAFKELKIQEIEDSNTTYGRFLAAKLANSHPFVMEAMELANMVDGDEEAKGTVRLAAVNFLEKWGGE